MSVALIDGDCLVYACGFASDANARANGEPYEDLNFCLHGVKETISSILKNSECDDSVIFLSHPINSRMEVFPEYKANRDPAHKPHWYKEIKEYLLDKQFAILSNEGDEADDALGIAQMSNDDTVICTLDKDLDQVPGWHYNFSKNRKADGLYHISLTEGDRFFYKQLLTGDATDNIPGMFRKLGVKATKKYTSPIDSMSDVREMYEHVVSCYKADEEFVKMVAKLLWIKRTENEWEVPK